MIRTLGIGLLALTCMAVGQSSAPPAPTTNVAPKPTTPQPAMPTQPPTPTQTTPQTQPPPMTLIKKSVVFLQGTYPRRSPEDRCFDADNKPSDTCSIIGTGFLLVYPDNRAGEGNGFSYLITNKHMVREPGLDEALGKGKYLQSISVRINTKKPLQDSGVSYTYGQLPVIYQSGDLYALVDTTDSHVDLAIIPISLNQETLDCIMISTSIFATNTVINDKHLDESDSVDFAGLFAQYRGNLRNYPIVRHGKLAMMSEERIPWESGVTEDLFLADVMSFGGNSGSPVFIRTDGDNQTIGSYQYYLLGVMQGYYPVDSKVSIQTAEINGVASENTGVAAVVPAQKILDILESPRAVSRSRIWCIFSCGEWENDRW